MLPETSYNFAMPPRVDPQSLRRLRPLHEGVARAFETALSELLRIPCEVRPAGLEQFTYGPLVSEIDAPACFYVLKTDPLNDRAVLDIEPAIVHPMIDRLLGGSGQAEPPPERPLTEIEWCLAARIVRLFLRQCQEAWKNELELGLDVLQAESNPRLVRVLPADEPIVTIGFELTVGLQRGLMRLGLPCRAIERIEDGSKSVESTPITGSIADAVAEVRVTLAESQIPAEDIVDLRVGDIIAMETSIDHPALVSIDGVARFRGKPGVCESRKAVRLTENLEEPEQIKPDALAATPKKTAS